MCARRSTTKVDRLKYPNFFYDPYLKSITQINGTDTVSKLFTPHHYIRQQWRDNNPEKFKLVEHLQKIFFLPTFVAGFNNCHAEVHSGNRNFLERWGFERDVFWFDENSV